MADDDIQVPADLPVSGTSAPETSEPLAQPDKESPSTGTEQPAEDAAPAETKAEGDQPEPEQPTEDKPEKKTPWFVERIAKQREELARERQQREELAARLAAFEQQQQGQQNTDQPQQQRMPSQAELQQMVRAEATRIAEAQAYQQKLVSFDNAGRKDYSDFVDRCNTVASLGAAENPVFMQAVTSMDDGHRVVAQLAENPQKAVEILSLPPVAMAVALARYANNTPAPKPPPVSTAPKPVKPISGAAKVDPDLTKASDSEWYRNWVKQQGAQA
jgi:hypothetical protein